MKKMKVAAPAKINLTLEVLDKREDGFHNIKSIMQAINLYDYLTFEITDSIGLSIELTGNSTKIPYDEKNLVHKAIVKFFEKANITNKNISVYIEKNIPIEAGLAGGSTDAAATFFALNRLFGDLLNNKEIDELCASLGSDLNFCYYGGTAFCEGRGEKITKISTPNIHVTLIKPLSFGISAKEAYTKFSQLPVDKKSIPNNTEKMAQKFNKTLLYNSLEIAVIDDYAELQEIKNKLPNSLMSGSGPTYFVLEQDIPNVFDNKLFLVIKGLKSITDGVKEIC